MGARFSKKNGQGGDFGRRLWSNRVFCLVTVKLPDRSFKHTCRDDSCYATGEKLGILF